MSSIKTLKTKKVVRAFEEIGLTHKRTKGSHASFATKGMIRPAVIQINKREQTPRIMKNNIKLIGMSVEEFLAIYDTM